MKPSDRYHKWEEWSEADSTHIGQCPDLITGIHGDDPVQLFAELEQTVQEIIQHFESQNRTLPDPRTRPMQEVV
jgi:hypothetical protein